jgi:hypothetical protein
MLGAAVKNRPDVRDRLVRRVLEYIASGAVDVQTAGNLITHVWLQAEPTAEEVALIAEFAPVGAPVQHGLFDGFTRRLMTTKRTTRDLRAAHALRKKEIYVPRDVRVLTLLDNSGVIINAMEALRQRPTMADFAANLSTLAGVAEADPPLVRLWATRLAVHMLDLTDPQLVGDLFANIPPVRDAYCKALLESAEDPGWRAEQAAAAFYLSNIEATDGKIHKELKKVIGRWIREASEAALERATDVIIALGPDWKDAWRGELGRERQSWIKRKFGKS